MLHSWFIFYQHYLCCQARVAEQNDVIQRIQDKLDEAEETVCFTKMSNRTLHVTINELQVG